jgi:L-asparagine transporter-like permease
MENKNTLKCTFAIEIQINKLFTLIWVTSINKFSCKYFLIKCSSVCCYQKGKAGVANNPYLIRLFRIMSIPTTFRLFLVLTSTNRRATSGVYAITVTTSAYHSHRCGRL